MLSKTACKFSLFPWKHKSFSNIEGKQRLFLRLLPKKNKFCTSHAVFLEKNCKFASFFETTMNRQGFLYKVFDLYYDGFRHMKLGKTLWAIILIKLFIIFAILKVFFFPDFIKEHAAKGQEAEFVATQILKP